MIRAFIAIELPAEVKSALTRLENQLKALAPRNIKWVNPDSIHLTLKFLGGIPEGRVAEITRAIEAAVAGISPFRLEVKGLGVFPNPRRVRVVWVGLAGDVDKLLRLQQQVEATASPIGFPTEARAFTPHLTLARVREEASLNDREALGALIGGTACEEPLSFGVDSVNLMRSQLTRGGAIYSRITSVKLK